MLIQDRVNFLRLRDACESLIAPDKRYPEYVFRKKYSYIYSMETQVAKRFSFVQALATVNHDQRVSLFFVDPGNETFWLPNSGHFGCCEVETNSNEREWESDLLFSKDRKTSMHSWEGQSAIFGNLQQWVIFSDYPFDLAILGSNVNLDELQEKNFQKYVHDIEWAIEYWKGNSSRMGEDFYSQFRKNYKSRNNKV